MRNFRSYGHCTCNENGHAEVSIDYDKSFWQWLFRKPADSVHYECREKGSFKFWYYKNTTKCVTGTDLRNINRILRAMQQYKIGEYS